MTPADFFVCALQGDVTPWSWIPHRPYVLGFLAVFIFLGVRRMGWRRTLVWLCSGYVIAWISEALSIRVGVPYGYYYYKYENLRSDCLIGGVPIWDSLSYPFMIFAGAGVARWWPAGGRWALWLRGAFCTMCLDIIVDPVSHHGAQWFLGDIYAYLHPGWYFGIPWSNFFGWFVVPLAVIVVNQPSQESSDWFEFAFYFSIALFGCGIAFAIGEWRIGFASLAIIFGLLLSIYTTRAAQRRRTC